MKVDDQITTRIVVLGQYGFSARGIAASILKYDGVRLSRSTIYRTLRECRVKLRAYRDYKTAEARQTFNELFPGIRPMRTQARRAA